MTFVAQVKYNAGDQYPWKVIGGQNGAANYIDSQHRLKQRAEKVARELAKDNRPSRLVIRRKDGDVSYTQRYET